jgi:hypothetical protein
MMISKHDKIQVLELVRQGQVVPDNETNTFVLFELIHDGMIKIINDPFDIHLTYFGLKELTEYDPVLRVSINNQLIERAHGDA